MRDQGLMSEVDEIPFQSERWPSQAAWAVLCREVCFAVTCAVCIGQISRRICSSVLSVWDFHKHYMFA